MRWGRVLAEKPEEIVPRKVSAKDDAQLRDLALELNIAPGLTDEMIKQAFDEAAGKHSVSYVRAVLLDWLGIERVHST